MKKIDKIKKQNKRLTNIAAFADVVIAYISAPFAAVRGVRHDIMDIKNIDKKLRFCDTYKRHFRNHIAEANSLKLYMWSLGRADARMARNQAEKYNPVFEIADKGLDSVLYNLSSQDVINVRYFEETEHQSRMPMRCRFGEYMINFASAGTTWYGGTQGNGYVFRFNSRDGYKQIATISPQLSNYLANIADEKFKMQQKQMSHSR